MKKPYRGDYKADYDKWREIGIKESKMSFFAYLLLSALFVVWVSVVISVLSYFFDIMKSISKFGFSTSMFFSLSFYIVVVIVAIVLKISDKNAIIDEEKYIEMAEKEAEQRYQADLDRYYHYLDADDEIDDRRLAREIKRKRTLNQMDGEQLLDMYGKLSVIQNQTNQQAFLFYQEAQNALHRGRKSDLESSLDNLEKALGL